MPASGILLASIGRGPSSSPSSLLDEKCNQHCSSLLGHGLSDMFGVLLLNQGSRDMSFNPTHVYRREWRRKIHTLLRLPLLLLLLLLFLLEGGGGGGAAGCPGGLDRGGLGLYHISVSWLNHWHHDHRREHARNQQRWKKSILDWRNKTGNSVLKSTVRGWSHKLRRTEGLSSARGKGPQARAASSKQLSIEGLHKTLLEDEAFTSSIDTKLRSRGRDSSTSQSPSEAFYQWAPSPSPIPALPIDSL